MNNNSNAYNLYNNEPDYLDKLYESYGITPAKNIPDRQKKTEIKKVKLTAAQRRELERKNWITIIKSIVACISMVVVLALVVNSYIARDVSRYELESIKRSQNLIISKNTEIKNSLQELASPEMINDVAVNVLGLIKIDTGNVTYINVSSGNKIITHQ